MAKQNEGASNVHDSNAQDEVGRHPQQPNKGDEEVNYRKLAENVDPNHVTKEAIKENSKLLHHD